MRKTLIALALLVGGCGQPDKAPRCECPDGGYCHYQNNLQGDVVNVTWQMGALTFGPFPTEEEFCEWAGKASHPSKLMEVK